MPRLKLNIPARSRAGVSKIRELDERTAHDIKAALDKVLYSSDPPSAAATDALASLSSTNPSEIREIATALGVLYSAKAQRDVSDEEIANDVCDILEAESGELKLAPAERAGFKNKLLILLSADVFTLSSKAWDLATDDERTFCHARILTDLRPVFGTDVKDGPKAMIVVHILKLGYDITANPDKHQDFYVTLDADDLQELRKTIERAEAKAKSLAASIKDMRVLGASKERG